MLAICADARDRGGMVTCFKGVTGAKVEGEGHLLTVMRYVEANPFRAGMVDPSEVWEWSSLWDRQTGERDLLHPSPLWLPDDWRTVVSVPRQLVDLERIRLPEKRRGRPPTRGLREAKK